MTVSNPPFFQVTAAVLGFFDVARNTPIMRYLMHTCKLVCVFTAILLISSCRQPERDPASIQVGSDTIRTVSIRYFPVAGDRIDIAATGDWGESVAYTRQKVDSVQAVLIASMAEGSSYHGYRDLTAQPSIVFEIVKEYEFTEALPTLDPIESEPPFTDYASIMNRIDARGWVENEGIKEFWIWAYHGGVVGLWESNMSSPFRDVSNSDRSENDLPVFSRTYTVYHYNYQRGAAEAMENHMHQLEAVLNYFDGRDTTRAARWADLLFWGNFVGSDSSHHLIQPIRAGWSHYPPNATRDYEWDNLNPVLSDIRNWNPDVPGPQESIDCRAWQCDHLQWFIFWTQHLPGRSNGLTYGGRPLRNWWTFLTDTDTAFREAWKLWE